ncbi:hypothetical protein SH2C18_31260 [Clostridium sediminicola]|uniref:hypothetical protein n=1 Tax=Clostridium sediminicola TaxID=3114879 RepID=UPI0031F26497
MNKKFKSQIKSAFDAPEPIKKTEFLQTVNYPKANRLDFILSQIGYIRKRVWLISCLILIGDLYGLYAYSSDNILKVIWIVSSILPFVALVAITEILRSQSFNMCELELSCKHSFADVVLVRLGVLGFFYFVLFSILLISMIGKTDYNIIRLGMYLLTPFLLTCTLSLITINHLHSRETIYICGGVSCFISLLNNLLNIIYNGIFADKYLTFWSITFFILIVAIVKELFEFVKRMEELQWNLQ